MNLKDDPDLMDSQEDGDSLSDLSQRIEDLETELQRVKDESLTWGKLLLGVLFGSIGILVGLTIYKWMGW